MRLAALATALVLSLPLPALAGPVADFEGALRAAYADYRAALFQSSAGNAEATKAAIAAFGGAVAGLKSGAVPPQYADDPGFGATFDAVAGMVAEAATRAEAGNLAGAHEALEGVRAQIGGLHLRNGLYTFSDRMNAYHAQMEAVLGADYAGQPDGMARLREDAAVLDYLARDIAGHPAPEAADPAYAQLQAGFLASVAALREAARAGDPAAAKAALAGLKAPYSKLFLRFG